MAFANPIVDGDGGLVVDQLQSENYVPGTSGWRISRDGDAEFASGTYRGTIEVTHTDGSSLTGTVKNGIPRLLFLPPNDPGTDFQEGEIYAATGAGVPGLTLLSPYDNNEVPTSQSALTLSGGASGGIVDYSQITAEADRIVISATQQITLDAPLVSIPQAAEPVSYKTAVDQATTSVNYVASTTECGGSFIAPASGRVEVVVTGNGSVSASGTHQFLLSYEIRVTDAAGAVVVAASDSNACIYGGTNRNQFSVKSEPVEGLTPGDTYWVRTMGKVTSGTVTGTAHDRRVDVTPIGP